MAVIIGNNQNNTLTGTSSSDLISGKSGSDTINGGAGNDLLSGGSGNDTINGGAGNDLIDGGSGNDTLNGGSGNDIVDGGSGNDLLIYTLAENIGSKDYYIGGSGTDTLQLNLTQSEYNQYKSQILAYQSLLNQAQHGGCDSDSDYFHFSFGLNVAQMEKLNVVITTPVNVAPVAAAVAATGLEDAASIAITLSGTDSDGTVASFKLAGLPANGTLYTNAALTTVAVAGTNYAASGNALTLYFKPAADFNGSVNFNYTATDNSGAASAAATATLNVTAVNDAPIAVNDAYTTNEDTALVIPAAGVLANDTDVDSASLSAAVVTGPAHGTLSMNADGSFTYTPTANYNGTDSFTYKAFDGSLPGNTATVNLTINSVNDAPVAAAASATGLEDAASIPVTLTGSDIDGTVASFKLAGLPANGTFYTDAALTQVAVAGTDYAASGNALILYFKPAADFNGTSTFIFSATDNNGASSASTTGSITVTPVNDAPVAVNDAYTTDEDTSLVIPAVSGVLANDHDVDSPSLTATFVSGPAHGTLVGNADGSFTYTPTANYNGADSFSYKASDGSLDSNVTTVNLTINSVNDAPAVTAPTATGLEDAASIPVTLTGADIDGTVASFKLAGLPANGTFYTDAALTQVAVAGTDYAASANALTLYFKPAANFNGTSTFVFSATDNEGASSASTTGAITVTPVNDAPVAVNDAYTTNEDTALVIPAATGVLANDTDVDSPSLTAIYVSGPAHGSLVSNANGSFTYTPNANYNGADSFSYKASDGSLDSNVATVNLTINSVNDAPIATSSGGGGLEDAASIPVVFTGFDADGSIASFKFSALPAPSAGAFYVDAGLTTLAVAGTDYAASGGNLVVYFKPAANFNGSANYTFSATDNEGASSPSMTNSVFITPVNDAPVAVGDSYTMTAGSTLVISAANGVLANDTDVDSSSLTAVYTSNPIQGTFTGNSNGSFSYTALTAGTYTFVYQAFDGQLSSNNVTVTIAVHPAIDITPPIVADATATGLEDAGPIPVTLTATDDHGPVASINIFSLPGNGTLYSDAGLTQVVTPGMHFAPTGNAASLYFAPNANFNGTANFLFNATDNSGNVSAPASAIINVIPVNDAPVITSNGGGDTATVNVNENTTTVAPVLATDVDSPVLTYSITGGADSSLFTLAPGDGLLHFINAPDYENPTDANHDNIYDVTVSVSDGQLTDSQAISVAVQNVAEIDGTSGNDNLFAISNFTVNGGAGSDVLFSTNLTNVILNGQQDNDTLLITGGNGISANGNDGNDTINATDVNNLTANGGTGNDTINISGGSNIIISGDSGDDNITATGNSSNITIYGNEGNDNIASTITGTVNIYGGSGNDSIQLSNTSIENIHYSANVSQEAGIANADTIANFQSGQDSLVLASFNGVDGFKGDANHDGVMDAGAFGTTAVPGATDSTTAGQYFVYATAPFGTNSNFLYYDADANGAGHGVLIESGAVLAATDIHFV